MTATNGLEKYQDLLNNPTEESIVILDRYINTLNEEVNTLLRNNTTISANQAEYKRLHRDMATIVRNKILLIIG